MSRASQGTPAKARGENSATVLGRAVAHRVNAIVGQVFDELEKRAEAGKGDIVAMIADEVQKAPMSGLERLAKLLPQEPPAGPGGNINMMFLQAVKLANGYNDNGGRVIEATAHPATNNDASNEW